MQTRETKREKKWVRGFKKQMGTPNTQRISTKKLKCLNHINTKTHFAIEIPESKIETLKHKNFQVLDLKNRERELPNF